MEKAFEIVFGAIIVLTVLYIVHTVKTAARLSLTLDVRKYKLKPMHALLLALACLIAALMEIYGGGNKGRAFIYCIIAIVAAISTPVQMRFMDKMIVKYVCSR